MLTTDLALRVDPVYEEISRRFLEHPDQFADAFARAWFKLTHRDMGPIQRYLGPLVPSEELIWQDRVPAVDHQLVGATEIADLKAQVLASGLRVAAAGVHRLGVGVDVPGQRQAGWRQRCPHPPRAADRLGGQRPRPAAPGAAHPRGDPAGVQLGPERWHPHLAGRPDRPRRVRRCRAGGARGRGHDVTVPFTPGRTDASQEQTDVESFVPLEPTADGFRNYLGKGHRLPAEYLLVDRANLLNLSAPEMTVLVGGLRVLGANTGQSPAGVLTSTPGTLTNDFFVNLLDMGTQWSTTDDDADSFEGRDRAPGELRWTGSRGRPGLRLQLRAAGTRRGLRQRRRQGEVRR